MGLEEAIWTDAEQQSVVKGIQQTEQKYDEERKLSIINLQNEGFDNERISHILNISIEKSMLKINCLLIPTALKIEQSL